jgi:hypothetical protein
VHGITSRSYNAAFLKSKTPRVKELYIAKDKDSVSLVLIVIIACGKKEIVVKIAAA